MPLVFKNITLVKQANQIPVHKHNARNGIASEKPKYN
jgi:hypothetical protein